VYGLGCILPEILAPVPPTTAAGWLASTVSGVDARPSLRADREIHRARRDLRRRDDDRAR
jgi:hypothetical protein